MGPVVHLPFDGRADAGRALAEEITRRGIGGDAVVLGLARGGVPVAFEIADRLRLPLDIAVARKLGVPWQPELAMGAIAGEVQTMDLRIIQRLGISNEEIENVVAREKAQIKRHQELYRAGLSAVDLRARSVLVVDDGLATGSTMLAAVRHVRSLNPVRLIVAVPVGSEEACARVRAEVDDLICLASPRDFSAVSDWYRDFRQASDAEVQRLLLRNRRRGRYYAQTYSNRICDTIRQAGFLLGLEIRRRSFAVCAMQPPQARESL